MKSTKKIGLKKQTIANLTEIHLAGIKGGAIEEDNTPKPDGEFSCGINSCWNACYIDSMTNPN